MADKVTLESLDARMDSLDARMDKADARLDRVETDLGALKSDVGTLKSQSIEHAVGIRRVETDLSDFRAEVLDAFDDLKLQQKTMTAAVMEALTQLNLSRTYEKRIVRLEEAVFGKVD